MRPRRLHLASVIFSLVVILAVGAIAWAATHNKSTGDGIGSAKDQAAARTTLQTGLQLPAGLVRDPTFTACGFTVDACLTGSTSVATTLAALTAAVHSAGGSLPSSCSAVVSGAGASGTAGPRFTCLVEGELHGTTVLFMLGDGWLLPGHPTPRTAVLVTVEKSTPPTPPHQTGAPATAADVAALLPSTWASAPQSCAGGSTPPAPSPATSAVASTPPSAAPSLLTTSAPLPPCSQSALTINVSVHLPLATAATQLSALALAKGFRLDGKPCIAGSTPTSCGVWGERINSGTQELFVATLTDDGRGNTTGTLAVTQQSALAQQS
jgi:hypothetical protein